MMMHASQPTDAELISRYLKMGDQHAFAALVQTHERLVTGTAVRVTGNVEAARDVAQQVFAALAKKAWLLTDRTSLAGWLHHAARHIAQRMTRSETARQRRHERIALEAPAAQESQVWPALEEALAELPSAEREAVVMHHLQDQSYEEMAAALGVTAAAVRKRVSRGLKDLSEQLTRRGYGGSAAALLAGAAALQVVTPSAAAAATATATATVTVPFSLTLTTLMAHSVVKTAAVIALMASIPIAWLFYENSALRGQLDALRREVSGRPVTGSRSEAGAQKTSPPNVESEAGTTAASASALAPEESEMVSLMRRASQMSTAAFGDRMAELLTATDSLEVTTECTAMIATINGERMAACYDAFKKRKGMDSEQNSDRLRPLLMAAGQRDGLNTVRAMRAVAPAFVEMDTLVHGWMLSEPGAVVTWFNEQDDQTQQQALTGLVWGLGQNDFKSAKTVFDSFSQEDQARSAVALSRSLITNHGVAAVDHLIEGLSPELAQQCLDGALNRIQRRPPSEVVPWLAAKSASFPDLSDNYAVALKRWFKTDPAAAQRWQDQSQAHPP